MSVSIQGPIGHKNVSCDLPLVFLLARRPPRSMSQIGG